MPAACESPSNPEREFALISNGRSPHNDNHQRILATAKDLNWRTHCFDHCVIAMRDGVPVAGDRSNRPLASFDLVWMLGLGTQQDFLDRTQILSSLAPDKIVNTPRGMLAMHAKHIKLPFSPMAFSGNNAQWLADAAIAHDPDARWVVKPSAGSYGRGVRVAGNTQELHALLRQATNDGAYCVVQEFISSITAGETRTLVLNGHIIGSYLRTPDREFLANLSQGARATRVKLSPAQGEQVLEIAGALAKWGIRFAAIDMAFPYLVEVNVANPGGLATLAGLNEQSQDDSSSRFRSALSSLMT